MGYFYKKPEPVDTDIKEGKKYTKTELNLIADEILRQDAKAELCRTCEERGEGTGEKKVMKQEASDEEGHQLVLEFAQMECPNGHVWYQGEGKARTIGGDNPILFEEHIQSRRKREIYTTIGTPDSNIVSGIYNRSHPQGRKINSKEQRKKNGASWYR